MGQLTPILFRNDAGHLIEKDPEQIVGIIQKAMNSHQAQSYAIKIVEKPKWWQFWKRPNVKSININPIEALSVTDAHDTRLILLRGNTWQDLAGNLFRNDVSEKELEKIEENIKIAQKELTFYKRVLKKKKEK